MTLVNAETGEIVDETDVLTLRGEVTSVSLALPSDLSFDEWSDYGGRLARVAEGVMWWLGDWWRFGDQRYGERAAQALDPNIPYAFQTLMDAGWVSSRIEASRRREVLSFSHHKEVAALDPADQDDLLDLAEKEAWTRDDLRQAVRRLKTAKRIGKAAGEAADLSASGVFQVLYVDPPWRYEDAEPTRAIENNYPTMTLDEIKALEPPAADDSVLLMWATSPKLAEALEVVEAWGFEYRTCMAWVKADPETGKQHVGMGYYARQQHELLLIAKRGDLPVPAENTRPPSVVTAPRTQHSAKPERFYELIEAMYPDFTRVEMFARLNRTGWHAWGNQIEAA